MGYELQTRLLWSLSGSGLGTTLSANGNSGGFTTPQGDLPARSPVSLATCGDASLFIFAGSAPTGTSPQLKVSLDGIDDEGNIFPNLVTTATAITAAGTTIITAGKHAGTAGSYLVLPEWGRVSWTVTGTTPVFPNVEICLYGS